MGVIKGWETVEQNQSFSIEWEGGRMFPKVVQVIPENNYSVFVYFEDGKIVCYDARPILEKEVFQPLKDIHVFMNSCTVLNDTLAWDIQGNRDTSSCLDIDPDTLYDLPDSEEPFEMEQIEPPTDFRRLAKSFS